MYIAAFVAALLASIFLTRLVRDCAVASGWISTASSERHIHTRPVPRIGGIAIFFTLWAMILLNHWFTGHFSGSLLPFSNLGLKVMVPASLIFLLGLVDDFIGLGAPTKFVVQIAAAALLSWEGLGISHLPMLTGHPLWDRLAGLALTILWVVWVTNAFNLIDGLDGLAAGSALLAAFFCGAVALLEGNGTVLFLIVVLGGAVAGFLRYNFNPASIFLGDCGSLFIGFLLSWIAIAEARTSSSMAAAAFPVVLLGLPILDLVVAVFRRFLGGRKLFDADREHIHHKLLGLGLSHRQSVVVIYGACASFGFCGFLLRHAQGMTSAIVMMVVGLGVCVGLQRLRYHEFLELGRAIGRAVRQRRTITNGIRVRRAVEVLNSCTNLPQFCQILQQCLEPIGFDGFDLHMNSRMPHETDTHPFNRVSGSKLQYFWNPSRANSETNWILTLSLKKENGIHLGGFSLYCSEMSDLLGLDIDALTTTGFSGAVGAVVEKMQDATLEKSRIRQIPKNQRVAPERLIASGLRRLVPFPSPRMSLDGNDIWPEAGLNGVQRGVR